MGTLKSSTSVRVSRSVHDARSSEMVEGPPLLVPLEEPAVVAFDDEPDMVLIAQPADYWEEELR